MTDANRDAPADLPDEVTDHDGDLVPDPDPPTDADVRDEQQIVDLEGGDLTGGTPD